MKTKNGDKVYWTKEMRDAVEKLVSLGAPYSTVDFAAKAYWAASEIILRMYGIELVEDEQAAGV